MSSGIPSISPWTTSHWPTSTVLSSINPTHSVGLIHSYTSALNEARTVTDAPQLILLSQVIRGAEASLSIISAEEILATATVAQVQAEATQVIFNLTVNLKNLADEENLYDYNLNKPANIIYLVVYAFIFAFITVMLWWSRYHWYNITFFCGYALEFLGFLGRVLAFLDNTYMSYYLLQYVALTIAPAFIMGGVYFLFAQLVVIHGRQYSVLKPMWYSYFFIATDVLSLIIQAGGGASAASASSNHEDTTPGTNVMIAGIVVQVFAMTIFVIFFFEFLNRIYFKDSKEIAKHSDSSLTKRSIGNFFKLLFNTKSTREYKATELERYYNTKFENIRSRKLISYFPLALTTAVLLIYIRCVYRVVELAQGFSGYLISYEVYLMVLDALMVALAGFILVGFHPVFTFGKVNVIKLATIKKNHDEKSDEEKSVHEDSLDREHTVSESETNGLNSKSNDTS